MDKTIVPDRQRLQWSFSALKYAFSDIVYVVKMGSPGRRDVGTSDVKMLHCGDKAFVVE